MIVLLQLHLLEFRRLRVVVRFFIPSLAPNLDVRFVRRVVDDFFASRLCHAYHVSLPCYKYATGPFCGRWTRIVRLLSFWRGSPVWGLYMLRLLAIISSSVTSEPSSVDPFQISAASPRTAARRLTKDGRGRRGRGGGAELTRGSPTGSTPGRARGRKPHNWITRWRGMPGQTRESDREGAEREKREGGEQSS